MKKSNPAGHMEPLAVLLLFVIFAACVLAVLLTGAGAYQRLAKRDQAAYEQSVCAQYMATRVRQSDCMGQVSVEQFGEASALRLQDENGYITRIYGCNGWLMELYASKEADLGPEDGERLMEIGSLDFSMQGNLLEVTLTGQDGAEENLYFSLRSGERGAQYEK